MSPMTLGEPKPALTPAQEDYLRAIYLLGEGGPVAPQALAERLGVRPASVSGMLKKLAELGLVERTAGRSVRLTPRGQRLALEVVRHHRLLEAFLAQALGYPWDAVHAEADRLEHHISEELEERIAELLGHPERDPHGDPIPTPELTLPHRRGPRLSGAAPGDYQIQRVHAQDADALRVYARLGLLPGARLRLLEHTPLGPRVELATGRLLIPRELAEHLEVVP